MSTRNTTNPCLLHKDTVLKTSISGIVPAPPGPPPDCLQSLDTVTSPTLQAGSGQHKSRSVNRWVTVYYDMFRISPKASLSACASESDTKVVQRIAYPHQSIADIRLHPVSLPRLPGSLSWKPRSFESTCTPPPTSIPRAHTRLYFVMSACYQCTKRGVCFRCAKLTCSRLEGQIGNACR